MLSFIQAVKFSLTDFHFYGYSSSSSQSRTSSGHASLAQSCAVALLINSSSNKYAQHSWSQAVFRPTQKLMMICVGVSQRKGILFSSNAEIIFSTSITVIFGGVLFYGIAYTIGYLS